MNQARSVAVSCVLLSLGLGAACNKAGGKSSGTSSSSPAPAPSLPSESFEGVITSTSSLLGVVVETRVAIKGSRSRSETKTHSPIRMPPGLRANTVTITDSTSGEVTMLEPDKKTYTIITEADASKEHIKIAEGLLPVGSSTVTSEGKTETIAGHRCQYWQFGNGMQLCLAQGLGDRYESTPAGTKTAGWASKQKEMLDANPEYAKFIKGGAYPLKVINIVNGEPVVLSEVTRVERQALDDSLFTVPAGYTKEKAPTKEDFQATMKELESLTNGVDSQRGELRKDLDSQRKALEKELDALKKGPHSPRKAPLGK